jgi:hypothetical protein
MISRRQVADLNTKTKAFKRKNVELVVIGNGPEKFIEDFRKATRYKGALYTDPSLETYKILGFESSVTSLIGLNPLKAGIRALGTGYLQKGIQGSPLQQGGVLVVGPGNVVHYAYRSRKAGDHPSVEEILQACEM